MIVNLMDQNGKLFPDQYELVDMVDVFDPTFNMRMTKALLITKEGRFWTVDIKRLHSIVPSQAQDIDLELHQMD